MLAAGMSYRKAEWVPEAEVMEAKPQLLRNFMQRRYAGLCLSALLLLCTTHATPSATVFSSS